MNFVAILLMFLGMSALAMATPAAPEIDGNSGLTALTLLGGAILVFKSHRKRQ